MDNNVVLEVYLRKLIQFCEAYDAFSIPAAMMAGGDGIKLQDVYTHINYISREDYERKKIDPADIFSAKTVKGGGSNLTDRTVSVMSKKLSKYDTINFDSIKAKIDERIAELEGELNNNSDETVTSDILDEKEELNWTWFLSAPGGGKTTLLKMYCLAYAYKFYIELYDWKEDILGKRQSIEDVCKRLDITDNTGICPFFISVRDLKEEDFRNINEYEGFNRIIEDSVIALVKEEVGDFNVETFFKSIKKPIYIIDSVEEFPDNGVRNDFLRGLDIFSKGNKCYLSSRYREYMENDTKVERNGVKLSAKEYVIDSLGDNIVRDFAQRWYDALNDRSGRKKLDVEKDFLVPLYKNSNVRNLISNPLELTSLLMISSYDSYLPSDFAKIYGRSIELWLSWANTALIYNYEDVMRQLSQIAFQMATSENEKIVVSYDSLFEFIKNSRNDLKRYYQQEWGDDIHSIDAFIQFLCRSHLVNRSTEGYDFIHRQYQAYLVAYCISTNNFSRETRKEKTRFSYIEEHIREKDDFWNQIYKIIAMIDIELRDDIITTLLDLSREDSSEGDTNYYVSRLIELAIIPGVNFDDNESQQLIELILQDENRWKLFESKKIDLQEWFALNDSRKNELFVNLAVKKSKELPEKDKDAFRDKIATAVFYCIWQREVDGVCVEAALMEFYSNFINTNIMEMIYSTHDLNKQQIMVRDIAYSKGKEALREGGYSDYYMLIAAIVGYEEERNPYSCIDNLLGSEDVYSSVLVINILVIATWLVRCKKADRFGYDIKKGEFSKYSEFILRGLLDDTRKEIRRDYLAAYSDIVAIGETRNQESIWFNEDVYKSILKSALFDYKKDGLLYDETDKSFTRCFEHISLYPCEYADICKSILSEMEINEQNLSDKLKKIFEETSDLMNKMRAVKLLIMISDIEYDERIALIKIIEKQGKDFKTKSKLRGEDLEQAYLYGMEQLKDYFPEGKSILEDLDFSKFAIRMDYKNEEEEAPNDGFSLEELFKNIETSDSEDGHEDFYAQKKFEKAKEQYLSSFELLSCKNNLAYMLRRGEITSVEYEGVPYDVTSLLQDGIQAKEPYSLMNYALYISWKEDHYNYNIGLTFLKQYVESAHLLSVAGWWYGLKNKCEAEGFLVSMWLCDLDLSIFDKKCELRKEVDSLFPGLIEY